MAPIGYTGDGGKLFREKNLKSTISCQTPFKSTMYNFRKKVHSCYWPAVPSFGEKCTPPTVLSHGTNSSRVWVADFLCEPCNVPEIQYCTLVQCA
jgi:hypothetical protein